MAPKSVTFTLNTFEQRNDPYFVLFCRIR